MGDLFMTNFYLSGQVLLINTAVCASGLCCWFIVESIILNENFTK